MEHLERERTYFTLVDESGKGHPAMEYVAGTLDEEPTFQIVPLKRFVKLIGSGEPLEAAGEGQFVAAPCWAPAIRNMLGRHRQIKAHPVNVF